MIALASIEGEQMTIKKYEKISSYRLNKLINTFGGLDVCNFCPVKKECKGYSFSEYGERQCYKRIKEWVKG